LPSAGAGSGLGGASPTATATAAVGTAAAACKPGAGGVHEGRAGGGSAVISTAGGIDGAGVFCASGNTPDTVMEEVGLASPTPLARKRRKLYLCGKCGLPKKGHTCRGVSAGITAEPEPPRDGGSVSGVSGVEITADSPVRVAESIVGISCVDGQQMYRVR